MNLNERFPRVTEAQLDDEGRRLRQAILGGPRAKVPGQFPLEAEDGTLEGPFGVFLFSPAIGAPLQQLGAQLRSASQLSSRLRELATLAVAAELDSDFELRAHVPLALKSGMSEREVEAVLTGIPLPDRSQQALVAFCRANATQVAPEAEFEELCWHFDRQETFEITTLVAYYRGLASMLELNRIAPPPGTTGVPPTRSSTRERDAAVVQLIEEREITRLLISLAKCVDSYDFDGLAELYADDGELITPWGSHRGREGLADHVRKDLEKYRALHHVSASHFIDVEPGASSASVRMTLLATHVRDEAGKSFMTAGGHYEIELLRERGAWRLHRVHIVPAWFLDTDG